MTTENNAASSGLTDDLRRAVVSLELTAAWLDGGCDPLRAVAEIRSAVDRLRALSTSTPKAAEQAGNEPREDHECVYGNGDGVCRECAELAKRASDAAAPILTAEDVERQYRDGVHIGSGLPRASCPCGFCAKHRLGFNQGDAAAQPDERAAFEAWRDKRAFNMPSYGGLAEAYAWDAWQSRATAPQATVRGDAFRAAVEEMTALLENGEWAEHVAETIARGDELASRLETAITELHNDIGTVREARAAVAQAGATLTDAQRNVITNLITVAREAFIALDDSEEREGPDGREHVIDSCGFDSLHGALERLEDLPDDKPGRTLSAADKAEWALRALLATRRG